MQIHEIEALLAGSGVSPHADRSASATARRSNPRMRLLAVLLAGGGALLTAQAVVAGGLPGDTQATAICIGAFPYASGPATTVGMVDNYDLPADTAAPTLTATCATSVQGAGPAGSLPAGGVYTGTGTAPDAVYRMDFPTGNTDTLTITMDPTGAQDLSLIVYCNTVSSLLSDGLVIDDTGVGGVAESVTVGGIAATTTLYIVVDGYSTGATPPGPSGPYTLNVTSNGTIQPDPTCGAAPPETDLSITKTDGTTSATPGDSTVYTIVASNDGPTAVTDADVADTFPAFCTSVDYTAVQAGGATGFTAAGSGDIADTLNLPVGASVTYTATCNIDPAATGLLDNTATITSALVPDTDTGNNTVLDSDTLDPSADLSITKTDGTTSATPGGSTTYTIATSNAGPSDATGASVADTFPAACTSVAYTAVQSGGATGFTAAGSGDIADTVFLPAGASITYTATCDIAAGATGTLDNTATIAAPVGVTDSVTGNNSADDNDTLVPEADLSLVLADAPDPVLPGDSVTYIATITNAGPSAAATVAFQLPLPADTTFASIVVDPDFSCTTPAVGSGGTVDCTAASLLPATSHDIEIVVDVSSNATGSLDASATVTATSDTNTGNNTSDASTTVTDVADLSISIDNARNGVLPGDSLIYSVQVDNNGPADANGALVGVTLSATLADVEWTCAPSPSAACPNASGTGDINETVNLGASEGLLYEVIATVSPEDGDPPSVGGSASVDSPLGLPDPDTSNNSASDTDPILPNGIFSDGFEP